MENNNADVTNFVLVGVGGQGIILASTIVSEAAMIAGNDVKNNEVHGMAQRGGSVISQIRFGPEVYSPLVKKQSAHFVKRASRRLDDFSPVRSDDDFLDRCVQESIGQHRPGRIRSQIHITPDEYPAQPPQVAEIERLRLTLCERHCLNLGPPNHGMSLSF